MAPRRPFRFPRYVSAEEKRARIAAAATRLGKGRAGAQPVRIEGRQITSTFWGQAWCENLQSYADLAYRLERGRTYVRSGAVVDLKIEPGRIRARVMGTRLYEITIDIAAIELAPWKRVVRASAGRIASLVALLRGELPDDVLRVVTDRAQGLFPKPTEMDLRCSCPDHAGLCKHLAATLYGVGARLDTEPGLFFVLRGVRAEDLIEQATAGLAGQTPASAPAAALPGGVKELGELFGIELVDAPAARPPRPRRQPSAPVKEKKKKTKTKATKKRTKRS